MNFFKYISKLGSSIGVLVLILLNTTGLAGQAYVKFKMQEGPEKLAADAKELVAVDVYVFGDYDGSGVVNSANLIIDKDILKRSNYDIYKWESGVSAPGNNITYSPKPLQNPILNFASLEGVENGGYIGTLWLRKESKGRSTDKLDLKVRNKDLFFHSKVDGVALSYQGNIQTFVNEPVNVSVYPNPFTDEVHFMLRSEHGITLDPISIVVLDNTGRVHKRYENIAPELNTHQRLSLSDIPAGTYFLSIVQGENVQIKSEPIVKVH